MAQRSGLAKRPQKLKSSGIKRLIERALREQGIRHPLESGQRRHEWKALMVSKLFKTISEHYMKPINVEILMGHNIGVSASYYKPKEHEVLEDYLKAVDHLSIYRDKRILEKQISRLTEKQDEITLMKLKHEKEMAEMREVMERRFNQIFEKIDLKSYLDFV